MKPYLVPPDPNNDYGEPVYANSYIGFMKGIHQKDNNVYDSVEIWATPYNADPALLKPERLGAYPYTGMGDLVGGWGRLATIESTSLSGPFDAAIWTIASKTARRYPLPADHYPDPLLGLTRKHLWLGGRVQGDDPYLMRFNVQ